MAKAIMADTEYKAISNSNSIHVLPRIQSTPADSQIPQFQLQARDLIRAGFSIDQEVHICVLKGCIIVMAHKGNELETLKALNHLPI